MTLRKKKKISHQVQHEQKLLNLEGKLGYPNIVFYQFLLARPL